MPLPPPGTLTLVGALLPALAAPQSALPEHVLFDGRRLSNARFEGPPGNRAPQGLEFQGVGTRLASELELGAGDVGVVARLALHDRGGSGACVRIGDSTFGLDGEKGAMFVDGPLFGGAWARLDDGARWFATGKPFELALRRRGAEFSVAIDGKVALQRSVGTGLLGGVALESGRGRIVLECWSLEGSVAPRSPIATDERLQGQVEAAIARAVDWLLAAQLCDGSWRHLQHGFRGGQTALCAYTLLRADLPADHPSVVRAFLFLDHVEPEETYTAGLMAMAYEALREPGRRARIESLVKRIASWNRGGQWGYPNAHEADFAVWQDVASNVDLSNSQYAVLGLRAARHAGVEVQDKLWAEVIDRTLGYQEPARDGGPETRKANTGSPAGFGYTPESPPSLSMTAAGISVLEIARQALGPKLRGDRLAAAERAIRDGVAWLDANYTLEDNTGGSKGWQYYALYGVERVGTLLGLEELSRRNWYHEGARWFLKNQSDDGSWSPAKPFGVGGFRAAQEESDTCFAILFLRRASRPTVQTAGSQWFAREAVDPTESIRLRVSGGASAVLWIDGFSDTFQHDHGGTLGLRIARVEYVAGDHVLATVPGDPSRGHEGQGFAVRVAFDEPGQHEVKAVVHVVDPLAPTGATGPQTKFESRAVALRSPGDLRPWMQEAAVARARNLLRALPPKCSSSTALPNEGPDKALDGLHSTRWVSTAEDANPWVVLELGKPLKADTLVLTQGGTARDLAGRYDRIERVEVRLNRDKEALGFDLVPDEMQPSVLPLGRLATLSRLEIRVTRRANGKDWKGRVALSEIALERRSD